MRLSRHVCVFAVLTALVVATPALAFDRDRGAWSEAFMPMGLDGPPYQDGQGFCLTPWNNGIVVGGWFESAGSVVTKNVAAWNGTHWEGFGNGPDEPPKAVFDHGSSLLIGGHFNHVDGEDCQYVARWDAVDRRWWAMGSIGDEVRTFMRRGARVYACGAFPNPNAPYAPPYTPLAWWDGAEWNFEAVGYFDPLDWVYACADFGTSVVIGGALDIEIPFNAGQNLCLWNDEEMVPFVLDGTVYDIEPATGGVYVGGSFLTANDDTSKGLVFLGLDRHFSPVAAPHEPRDVRALTSANNTLYAATDHQVLPYGSNHWYSPLGGTFLGWIKDITHDGEHLYAAGLIDNGIVMWHDGEWVHLGGGIGRTRHNGSTLNCLVDYQGDLIAGGLFYLPQITEEQPTGAGIARWDGEFWRRMAGGTNEEVMALREFQGDLWVGGNFDTAGSLTTSNFARWDGTEWHDVGGADANVYALTVHDGELIAGGTFSHIGGAAIPRLAAFNGTNWHALASTVGGGIRALTTFRGELIGGGWFLGINGQPINHLARWDGSAWHALGTGVNGSVYAFGEWQGDLYVGGTFTTAGGVAVSNLARWDGAQWHDVGGGVTGANIIYGVNTILGTTEELFIGGDFDTAGSNAIPALAVWDGVAWTEFSGAFGGLEAPPSVNDLLVKDGDLWVAGHFFTVATTTSCNLAHWIDGTLVGNEPVVEDLPPPPSTWNLAAAPNPFNPRVEIRFSLQHATHATLRVFSLDGREVVTLASRDFVAGAHSETWTGLTARDQAAPSGIYVVRMETEEHVESKTVTLVR